ncbi:hypothetical protein K7432_000161 [Basidiobolus ranarum]|uniref:Uncharacterized protein n=1 Tax=Basidiobolus ranarum TaxID=34480 RepID=A0ABR2WBQ1_9FUNG
MSPVKGKPSFSDHGSCDLDTMEDYKNVNSSSTKLPKHAVSAWHTIGPQKSKLAAGEVEAGGLHRIGKNYKPNPDNRALPKHKNKNRKNQSFNVPVSIKKTSEYEVGSGQLHRQGKNFKPEYIEHNRRKEVQKYPKPNASKNFQSTERKLSTPWDDLAEQDEYQKIGIIIDGFSELELEETERKCTLFDCSSDIDGLEYWSDPTEDDDSQEYLIDAAEEIITYNSDKPSESTKPPASEVATTKNPQHVTSESEEETAQGIEQGEIIMLLDIEIHDGGRKTIVLHEFDDPREVAEKFCETWNVPGKNIATRLAKLITMEKEQLLKAQ